MVKIRDLRNINKDELVKNLKELRMELIKSNAQIASGTTPKNPGQIKQTKKTIARILTIQKDMKKKEEGNKDGGN